MSISTKGIYKNQEMMIHTPRSTDFVLRPNLQIKVYVLGFLLLYELDFLYED